MDTITGLPQAAKRVQHDQKAPSTLRTEPKSITYRMQQILDCDLSGMAAKDIGKKMSLSMSRIYQIIRSKVYLEQREKAAKELHERFLDKRSAEIANIDPVLELIRKEAMAAAIEKVRLFKDGQSEFVRNSASSDILDRAGYKPETKQIITSVEVTEDMAGRFERTLSRRMVRTKGGDDEPES